MAQQTWTDSTITQGTTKIKAAHFTELQNAINAWETAYGISTTSWSQTAAANTIIDPATITSEMQSALNALLQLTDSSNFTWNDTIQADETVKKVHMDDLRTNMNFMQHSRCYQCDLCDTEAPITCTCDNSCYSDACDRCYSSCYGYSACSCNNTCYGYSACSCNNACYNHCSDKYVGCVTCNNKCYGYTACSCNSRCYGYNACSCNSSCYNNACSTCNTSCYNETGGCIKCYSASYRYPWS